MKVSIVDITRPQTSEHLKLVDRKSYQQSKFAVRLRLLELKTNRVLTLQDATNFEPQLHSTGLEFIHSYSSTVKDVYKNRARNNRFTDVASLLVESELIQIDWVSVPADSIRVTVSFLPFFRRRLPLTYVTDSQVPSDLKVNRHPYIT